MADLHPLLTWTGDCFEPGVRLVIDGGRVAAVERGAGAPEGEWARRAVLPGMINAHSHAFQRGLRGRGERFPGSRGSFWTWREAMYGLVEAMDAETIHALSLQAFREMLAAGITTVGEFHYLHHDAAGEGYALDEVVLAAAADAGIRIVLLNAYYRTGGIGKPLEGGQKRFATPSLKGYWDQLDRLASRLVTATQSLGVVAHSIRAVPLEDLIALHDESTRREQVFHMHVEEQPAEIKACEAALGGRPLALINERLAVDERFCAVHCTHTHPDDMEAFAAAGGNVCICPLTEANLGDGIPGLAAMRDAGARVSLGTDSNARISFTEEMRWLEYVQRLATESRGVCVDGGGHCARALLEAATVNGARALGLEAGSIAPGALADLIVLDLDAPGLAGWTDDTLLEAFVLGAGDDAIALTIVDGETV